MWRAAPNFLRYRPGKRAVDDLVAHPLGFLVRCPAEEQIGIEELADDWTVG